MIAKAAATTLDSETMEVRQSVVTKTASKKRQYTGEKPMSIPAEVATALPPLKPAKIGNVCPKTAAKPKTIGDQPLA